MTTVFAVGLTGGIASGKSLVGNLFSALGATILDADLIAREVVSPGEPALHEIADAFGAHFILVDGALDRSALRKLVFADPTARLRLEAITHPRIRRILEDRALSALGEYVIASVPLLTEAGGRSAYPWLARVLVVDAPAALQARRLEVRDSLDSGLANRMIAAQATRGDRLGIATDVLINDGDRAAMSEAVERLHAHYLCLARESRAAPQAQER
jgi:dephospho-CoA kinase